MFCLDPERGRKKTFMIQVPRTERDQHNFKLQTFCLVDGKDLHRINTAGNLNRLLMSVESPPFQEHAQVVALAGGEFQHDVLERLKVCDLAGVFPESEYADKRFRQFKQR